MSETEFSQLNLSPELTQTVQDLGYAKLTPIQKASIPLLLKGKDIIGLSQTGSGKTAAYAIPILQRIRFDHMGPQALILCPTRELCEQVLQEFKKFSKRLKNISSVALVGGQPYPPQIESLEKGAKVVIGTPGRTLEMLKNRHLKVLDLKTLVLDEADRMLDEGFLDEVVQVIKHLPSTKQTAFFSATFPEGVLNLSRKFQKNPQTITINEDLAEKPQIEEFVYKAENTEKVQTLIRVLQQHPSDSTLI
jgi:ATP-dependent RNA helicase DbpA